MRSCGNRRVRLLGYAVKNVIFRRHRRIARVPALGVALRYDAIGTERTSRGDSRMSASTGKADMAQVTA